MMIHAARLRVVRQVLLGVSQSKLSSGFNRRIRASVEPVRDIQPATMRRQRLIVWLIALLPVLLVFGFGTYHVVSGPDCASCHSSGEFGAQTAKAAHASVDCASCHVPAGSAERVVFGFRQAFHMTIPLVDGQDRGWDAVPDSRCVACHDTIRTRVVEADGIRIDHQTCAANNRCSDCHSSTAHGTATKWVRASDMESCLSCHAASEASADCGLCHAGKLPKDRVATGVFKITHGAQWEKTHGMGDAATCAACHTAASCEKCHGAGLPHAAGFVKEHSSIAASPKAKCGTCHEKSFCNDCHGLAMPHPNRFVRGHSAQAQKNEALCGRCHVRSDCMTCHEKHVHPGGAIGALSGAGGGQ